MNKTELIAAVAEKSGLTRKDSEKAVLAALETITETLKTGEKVQLVGFGVFETRVRPAHKGHNPMTGAEIQIAESKICSLCLNLSCINLTSSTVQREIGRASCRERV